MDFRFLQLSMDGLDSLEKVNLSSSSLYNKSKIDVPHLLDIFQKLHSAKFLILDVNIIETLSSYMVKLACEPCPFNNQKSLKINVLLQKPKVSMEIMASQVRNYLLESSPSATFLIDLSQVSKKRSRQPDIKAKEVVKLAEPEQKVAKLAEQKHEAEKRILEEKLQMIDEVIANQNVMQESVKLQHENLTSQIIRRKMTELRVEIEGRNPNYEFVRLMVDDIKSLIDSTPESLRVAVETQFFRQDEEVKRLLLTHIDASQWAKVESELGLKVHFLPVP